MGSLVRPESLARDLAGLSKLGRGKLIFLPKKVAGPLAAVGPKFSGVDPFAPPRGGQKFCPPRFLAGPPRAQI